MPKLHIDVVNKRKLWYAISAVLLLVGVVSLLCRRPNPGIEFSGGNIMQLQFSQTVDGTQIFPLLYIRVNEETQSVEEIENLSLRA